MRTLLVTLLLLPVPALAAEPTRLTLPQAFDAAEKSSPDLAAAAERVEQANDDARGALAAVLPQVKAEGTYSVNSNQFALTFGPASFVIQPWDVTQGQLAARWPVLNAQAFPALSAAKHGSALNAAVAKQGRQELLYATAQAWWALVATDNLVKAANEGVSNASELARVAGEQVRAQVATKLAS